MSGINNGLLSLKENRKVDLHNEKTNLFYVCSLFKTIQRTDSERKVAAYLGTVLSSKLLFINIWILGRLSVCQETDPTCCKWNRFYIVSFRPCGRYYRVNIILVICCLPVQFLIMEKRKQNYRKTSKGIGRKIMHTLAARVVIVVFFCLGATELSGEAGNSTLRSVRSLLLPFRESNAIRKTESVFS